MWLNYALKEYPNKLNHQFFPNEVPVDMEKKTIAKIFFIQLKMLKLLTVVIVFW